MPCYTYKCDKCNKVFDSYCSISERNNPKECECGKKANRNAEAELNGIRDFDITCKSNPRWSWSMGCHINQIPELTKKFPDRKYHPKTGQLLVESRKHKLKLMKENNLIELD